MARRLRILVPPSEGKADGGTGERWQPGSCALPGLDEHRAAVLDALGRGVADRPCRPAIERYTGVLYGELDWASLPGPAKRRGRSSMRTFSGLWGVVAPPDPIPDYRLKMSASLPGLGRLSAWWRPHLDRALADDLAGADVWDLLPNEHSAAWSPDDLSLRRRVTVQFLDAGGRTVSHWNKLLKGSLVRLLLTEGAIAPDDLADWRHPAGYRLDLAASVVERRRAHLVFREH